MQFLLKDHLEKLESFLVIAEKGSIRKASESLGVTQPALSRQINILEDVLEQSLVERTRQGVELTEAGRLLRDFSRSLLRDAEDIERKIRKPQEKLVGNVIIGTFESLSIRVWPEIVADLRRQFPVFRSVSPRVTRIIFTRACSKGNTISGSGISRNTPRNLPLERS